MYPFLKLLMFHNKTPIKSHEQQDEKQVWFKPCSVFQLIQQRVLSIKNGANTQGVEVREAGGLRTLTVLDYPHLKSSYVW